MAYVASIGKVLYFGGVLSSGSQSDETWLYDGIDWAQVTSAFRPTGRTAPLVAYDEARDRVVLYGGEDQNGSANDTWEWSQQTGWYPVFTLTNPGRVTSAGFEYGGPSRGVLLHGGRISTTIVSDTWLFDGSRWRRDVASLRVADHSLVWDRVSDLVHCVGGTGPSIGNLKHFILTDRGWERAAANGLPWQIGMTVWDDAREKVVQVVGGGNPILEFDTNWVASSGVQFGSGCGSAPPVLTQVPGSLPVFGGRGAVRLQAPAGRVSVLGFGFSNTFYGSIALPTSLVGAGMGSCLLLVALDEYDLKLVGSSGVIEFDLAIPLLPELVGGHIYFQAFVADPGANSLGVVVSNGVDWTVGNR